jgi:hypothetical protein
MNNALAENPGQAKSAEHRRARRRLAVEIIQRHCGNLTEVPPFSPQELQAHPDRKRIQATIRHQVESAVADFVAELEVAEGWRA